MLFSTISRCLESQGKRAAGWGPFHAGILVVFELALLRWVSYGRYWSLGDFEVFWLLLQAHVATKLLALISVVLLSAMAIRAPFRRPAVTSPKRRLALLAIHFSGAFLLAVSLPFLPVGKYGGDASLSLFLQYAIAIAGFGAMMASVFIAILPRVIIEHIYTRQLWFAVFCFFIVLVWATKNGTAWVIPGTRQVVEGATLSIALGFYDLITFPMPDLVYYGAVPHLVSSNFSIAIAPSCSGYQGMMGALVLLGSYVMLEHRSLHLGRTIVLVVGAVGATFVLNGVRIATLFYIGAEISPEIAVNGFHSKFGTFSLFLVSALAMLAMEHPFFRKDVRHKSNPLSTVPIKDLGGVALMMAPLALYLLMMIVAGLFVGAFNWLYPIPVFFGGVVIWVLREPLRNALRGTPSPVGLVLGIIAFLIWIAVVPSDPDRPTVLSSALADAPLWLAVLWVAFRVVGSSLVVPLFEELAFRGGIQPMVWALIPEKIAPVLRSGAAVLVTALTFGLLHANIAAACLVGILYGLPALRKGGLTDAVVAHAITNFLIALAVLGFDQWSLW